MQGVVVTLMTASVTGQDAYHNDIVTWSSRDVAGCAVVPRISSEATQGAEQVVADAEAYLPAGTEAGPLDRIAYAGVTYEVTGQPSAWTSPFTLLAAPVMVRLRFVEGGTAHSISAGAGGGGGG